MHTDYQSFAYTDETNPTLNKLAVCIDLHCTPISELSAEAFPNLRKIRASRCNRLSKIVIKDCPCLQIIDISVNTNLQELDLDNLPQVRTVSIEFTPITSFAFFLPNLECLMIHSTDIQSLSPSLFPKLLSIDVSGTKLTDIRFISDLKHLLRIKANRCLALPKPLDFSIFTTHPTLKSLHISNELDLSTVKPETSLKRIALGISNVSFVPRLLEILPHVNIMSPRDKASNPQPLTDEPWLDSMRLIYGPWGIPPCDRATSKPVVLDVPHPEFDTSKALDSVLGAVYGSALGDALGVCAEFKGSLTVRAMCETCLDITWSHIEEARGYLPFARGTSTDDTDQAVLIMRSIADSGGDYDLTAFAASMREWSTIGIAEHKHGYCFDIGNTTRAAVSSPDFLSNPIRAAKKAWNKHMTGNGSAMRTAPVGCFKFWDQDTVIKFANGFGRATHYDNRCACGAILISLLVSQFIQMNCGLRVDVDIDEAISTAINASDAPRDEVMKYMTVKSFDELDLNNRDMGYVLRSVGAAILALRLNLNYEQGIAQIILYGGDADTNAAIAGAVLGARWGFASIPTHIMKYLFNGNWIYKDLERMIATMGIEPPPSPFDVLSFET